MVILVYRNIYKKTHTYNNNNKKRLFFLAIIESFLLLELKYL